MRLNYKLAIHHIVTILVFFNSVQGQDVGFSYSSYQQGLTCNAAQKPLKPTSLQDIQEIIRDALRNNQTLKALGNRHSTTDIICTYGIPISMKRISHFSYDEQTESATVGAGSTLFDFLEHAHQNGRTVSGLPSYGDITIGGALGTGAHGTNLRNAATLSDQVVSLVIVDGLGEVRNITDPETVRAFKVHLGVLGIVYEVTIKTVPQFKLQIRNFPVSDGILWNGDEIMRMANSNEYFQFWWFPTAQEVVLSVGNSVPIATPGNCQTYLISELPAILANGFATAFEIMQENMDHLGMFLIQMFTKRSLYEQVPGKSPIFTENGRTMCRPAIGFNHRMISNRCNECAWNHGNMSLLAQDFEVIVPLSEFKKALETVRAIMQEYPMEFALTGMYFRFMSASDALMSINSGRASVGIEWVLVPRKNQYNDPMLGLPGSQAMIQALTDKHEGRTHWAKNGLHYLNPQLIREKYEHLETFVRHMEQFDPHGVFLNDFGRRLRHGSQQVAPDNRIKHCALTDRCICASDSDCGNGGPNSYNCDILQGYRVCKEEQNSLLGETRGLVRQVLSLLTPITN